MCHLSVTYVPSDFFDGDLPVTLATQVTDTVANAHLIALVVSYRSFEF